MGAVIQNAGSLVFEGLDEESNDYRLEGRSVWISIEELSVYVHRTPVGITVDIYPRSNEADDQALASCAASFADTLCVMNPEDSAKDRDD